MRFISLSIRPAAPLRLFLILGLLGASEPASEAHTSARSKPVLAAPTPMPTEAIEAAPPEASLESEELSEAERQVQSGKPLFQSRAKPEDCSADLYRDATTGERRPTYVKDKWNRLKDAMFSPNDRRARERVEGQAKYPDRAPAYDANASKNGVDLAKLESLKGCAQGLAGEAKGYAFTLPHQGIRNRTKALADIMGGDMVERAGVPLQLKGDRAPRFALMKGTVFGGPRDKGIKSKARGDRYDEKTALTGEALPKIGENMQDPNHYYCAMRLDYKALPKGLWKDRLVFVHDNRSGRSIVCKLKDWGPNGRKGKANVGIDLSPAAAGALAGKNHPADPNGRDGVNLNSLVVSLAPPHMSAGPVNDAIVCGEPGAQAGVSTQAPGQTSKQTLGTRPAAARAQAAPSISSATAAPGASTSANASIAPAVMGPPPPFAAPVAPLVPAALTADVGPPSAPPVAPVPPPAADTPSAPAPVAVAPPTAPAVASAPAVPPFSPAPAEIPVKLRKRLESLPMNTNTARYVKSLLSEGTDLPEGNRNVLLGLTTMPEGGRSDVKNAAWNDKVNEISNCSIATYRALGRAYGEARASAAWLKTQGADGQGSWGFWNANGPGTARLFSAAGIGRSFVANGLGKFGSDAEKPLPGDFMKVWWKSSEGMGNKESGHSVVYLGDDPQNSNNVLLWSSHKASNSFSGGYGIKSFPKSDIAFAVASRLNDNPKATKQSRRFYDSALENMRTGGSLGYDYFEGAREFGIPGTGN